MLLFGSGNWLLGEGAKRESLSVIPFPSIFHSCILFFETKEEGRIGEWYIHRGNISRLTPPMLFIQDFEECRF